LDQQKIKKTHHAMKNKVKTSPISTPLAVSKPLKRPSQPRAKFTVQAIYDAFIRIWQREGWSRVTTRAVALETGIAVGTFYDYFPNKEALLSGYVRHCLDSLLESLAKEATLSSGLSWQQRVNVMINLTCGSQTAGQPLFDHGMLMLAEPKHHLRVFQELSAAWRACLDACPDLPSRPTPAKLDSLLLAVWGGRRYFLLLSPAVMDQQVWIKEMQTLCEQVLSTK
jgi:AcrR family transcriptional regulator